MAVLALAAVIAARAWTPHAGTLDAPENPYLALVRIGLGMLFALLGWQWLVRRRQTADRVTAGGIVCVATGLCWRGGAGDLPGAGR